MSKRLFRNSDSHWSSEETPTSNGSPGERLAAGVVTVNGGRGFIVETAFSYQARGRNVVQRARLVITAAHCLPSVPPAHAASKIEERTYANLLGRLDDEKPTVWAECAFIDTVADIAVLTRPDHQLLGLEAEAYDALVDDAPAFDVATARRRNGRGWLLGLDRQWQPCALGDSGAVWIAKAAGGIRGGMSGSPILNARAEAVGIVCVRPALGDAAFDAHKPFGVQTKGGPNPALRACLPGRILRGLKRARVMAADHRSPNAREVG
jgi:hypothetical protein